MFGKEKAAASHEMRQPQRKPLWSTNENPGPGMYDQKKADGLTKYNQQAAKIVQPMKLYQRPREISPDAG